MLFEKHVNYNYNAIYKVRIITSTALCEHSIYAICNRKIAVLSKLQIRIMVAVKQADRQASRILKMRSSKPKNFRIPVF